MGNERKKISRKAQNSYQRRSHEYVLGKGDCPILIHLCYKLAFMDQFFSSLLIIVFS